MKHLLSWLLVVASISVGSFAHAQTARVIKVKGQQAIVQFPPGTPPVVGETLPINGEPQSDSGAKLARGSRAHTLGIEIANITFLNDSATNQSTTIFDVRALYGWNQEIFEFGPLAEVRFTSTTGRTTRLLLGGGFFDFNFVPNKSGVALVYGVGGSADVGQESSTTGAIDLSNSRYDLFAGGNLKWFGLSENVAIRGDAGFQLTRTAENGVQSTISGFALLAGLSFYF